MSAPSSGLTIARFVAKRALGTATLWGTVFGAVAASSAIGFLTAFPTAADKLRIVATFGNNVGLKAAIGMPYAIDTLGGFTQWRAIGTVGLMGAIWGIFQSTQILRGDEEEGRWELIRSGVTTARQATAQALLGLLAGLVTAYGLISVILLAANQAQSLGLSAREVLLFSLVLISGPAMFMAVGALASQLASSRRQAMVISAAVLGVAYLLRAGADTSDDYGWLRNFTPFGWLENVRVFGGFQPGWLLAIGGLVAVCAGLTIYLSGRRDLGSGYLKESATGPSSTALLGSVWGFSLRMGWAGMLGWGAALGFNAFVFGSLAKTAAEAFRGSSIIQQRLSQVVSTADSAATYLGLIFLLFITGVMIMVAGNLGGIRDEEASGRLDVVLVRRASRAAWLVSRLLASVGAIAICSLLVGVGALLAVRMQGIDLSVGRMLVAGVNIAFPALFTLGIGTLVFGCFPRATTIVAYAIPTSSFLIEILAPSLNAPNWLLNLSVLHKVGLAPAVDPNWTTNLVLLVIGLLGMLIGAIAFSRRDTVAE